MPDNNTKLPILDDIIKPGDADKATHQPSNTVQSSLLSDEESNGVSATRDDAETSLHTTADDRPDGAELFTDDQSDNDAIDRMQVSPATAADDEFTIDDPVQLEVLAESRPTQPSAVDLPDIDALTEEILDNLILQIEPLLRDRIQQTLSKHFPGDTRPD